MRDTQHHIAHQQRVQLIHIEFAQCNLMKEAQYQVALHHIIDRCQPNTGVEPVSPAETKQCHKYSQPCQWIRENLAQTQIWSTGREIAEEAKPVTSDD